MTLLSSVRENYPEITFHLLVTEPINPPLIDDEFLVWLSVEDLQISVQDVDWLSSFYDRVEFATALKPHLLRHILGLDFSACIFLDPDMMLLANIDDVFEVVESGFIALTPHRFSPVNCQESFYSDSTFLQFGTYNLGFIGVGSSSEVFLEWWAGQLITFGTRFPNDLYFTDQKWINLAPAYFNCEILKDPGLNLAPWNLDERPLQIVNGRLMVGQQLVRLIHFSQMSGTLASGKTSDLWRSMFPHVGFNSSIQIIEEYTTLYALKLQNVVFPNNFVLGMGRLSSPSFLYKVLALKYRKLRFQKSVGAFLATKVVSRTRRFSLFDSSYLYFAILKYLPMDLRRLRNRRLR
jgi:hypothetical protein